MVHSYIEDFVTLESQIVHIRKRRGESKANLRMLILTLGKEYNQPAIGYSGATANLSKFDFSCVIVPYA